MVHRDFKPANVLLGPDGPVVIDFGLATVPGMTTMGQSGQAAVGTPAFMAPEQLAARRVTAAADMWSWAISMTFAGTGQLPFTGESLTAIAYAILHGEPVIGSLSEPLGSLVRRCLSKNPALRPSARDALRELVAAGAQPMGPLPPPAATIAEDDEASRSAPTPVDAPEPQRVAVAGPRHGRAPDQIASSTGRPGRRRRRVAAALLASALLIGGTGGLIILLSQHGPPPTRSAGRHAVGGELEAQDVARKQAITWIVQQVSRSAFVSCDANVCNDLAGRGFLNVIPLGPESSDPLGSTLLVDTAAIRAQFGPRLASVYAPALLATFGTGKTRIEIRYVPPGGAKAYRGALAADQRARMTADTELLANSQITFSATARAQIRSGDIDPRLPQLLAAITHSQPVRVVAFGDQAPGGGPADLLRSMELATAVSTSHLAAPAYLRWMQQFVHAQRAPYRPALSEPITLPNGQSMLLIQYEAPSPLS
jgi:hypothetical protein